MGSSPAWLRAEEVELGLRLAGKQAVIGEVSRLLGARRDTAPRDVFGALWHRESLGSTGLGHGVALPHARMPGLECGLGAFVRLQEPIAFDAPDNEPVAFVLALLLPNRDPQRQLDLLAELAARFADGRFRERIAAASCSRTVCNLLTAGLRA